MLGALSGAAGRWFAVAEQGATARAPLPLGGFPGNHPLTAMCVLGEDNWKSLPCVLLSLSELSSQAGTFKFIILFL